MAGHVSIPFAGHGTRIPTTAPILPHLGPGIPQYWQVAIFPKDSPRDGVTAWMGQEHPQPSGGGGGHEAVVMPKRSPVSFWRGRPDLMAMTLPVMFDGWASETGVADMRRRLIRMWRPDRADVEPPVVNITAAGDALPWQGVDWTITGVEFGDMLAGDDMTTLREFHTVTLQEYVPDERLDATAATKGSSAQRHTSKKRRDAGGSSSTRRTYTVRSGDTLAGIAARKNVKGGWRALADAQRPPITDPRGLRVGQVLTLP